MPIPSICHPDGVTSQWGVLLACYLTTTVPFYQNQLRPRMTVVHHLYLSQFSRVLGYRPGAVHVWGSISKRDSCAPLSMLETQRYCDCHKEGYHHLPMGPEQWLLAEIQIPSLQVHEWPEFHMPWFLSDWQWQLWSDWFCQCRESSLTLVILKVISAIILYLSRDLEGSI